MKKVQRKVRLGVAPKVKRGAPPMVLSRHRKPAVRAVEGEPVSEAPPRKARSSDEAGSFLSMYFREMAQLAVLRPNEEFEAAKRIEALDVALWAHILNFPGNVDHLLRVVERAIDNSLAEFRALRRSADAIAAKGASKKSMARNRENFERLLVKTAERLRVVDVDKEVLDVVLAELHRVENHSPDRLVSSPLSVKPESRAFIEYLERVERAHSAAQRAKNQFVTANLRLVVSIARRFNYGRMPLADLIQEGNIGLIKAVERFDHRRGYRFSTYASWWIRHAISRALADKGRAVRLPVHMIDAYHRVGKATRDLTGQLNRQPTSDEIALATGIPTAKIEKMRSFLLDQSLSLDRAIGDEDGRKFVDFLVDPNHEDEPADKMSEEAVNSEVRHLLMDLKPIEADILRQRFGFDSDEEHTLKEIGQKYRLSRERIRQLQEQALGKVKRALERKALI